jgi:hypothetical protein
MDWKRIANRAKEQIDKRGGTDGLKRDATTLRDIAKRHGSLTDKAKQAAEELKRPAGTPSGESAGAADESAGAAEAPTGPTPSETTGPETETAKKPASTESRPEATPAEQQRSK